MFDLTHLAGVRSWAIAAHGQQKYGDQPYSVHLDAVHAVAVEFGLRDPVVLASTLLHDVIEDTAVDRVQLAERYGDDVANVVWAVTNEVFAPDGAPLVGRKQRGVWTYPKIAASPRARLVKLCDRIANARASHAGSPKMLEKYRSSYAGFREGIRPDDAAGAEAALWSALDDLLG